MTWTDVGGGIAMGIDEIGPLSTCIDVPPASGSQAVTVLVWPAWGDGGLKLGLDGGRRYEFSAWAKWQGRSTPLSRRIALPDGAEKGTRSGSDPPTSNGWCRLWTRSELALPAVPKYLGLWCRGPARVQFTLSGRGGEVVGRVAGPFAGKTPIVPEPSERADAVMLLAPTVLDRCEFAFDPSRLALGRYELTVELLDPRGEVVATRAKTVHRVSD